MEEQFEGSCCVVLNLWVAGEFKKCADKDLAQSYITN